jgi:arylsulfatase A-like enzyme
MRERILFYGIILRPWLCVVVYLWGLQLQAVYRSEFTPVLDSLADSALILWTLSIWAAAFSLLPAVAGRYRNHVNVRRGNEIVCSGCCILISAVFLTRWMAGWELADAEIDLVTWGLPAAVAFLCFLVWRKRQRVSTDSKSLIPSWSDCFSYIVIPVLAVTVAAVGTKIASVMFFSNTTMSSPLNQLGPDAPNIIVVVSDSLRAQSMSLYGHSTSTTPFLDRFAETSSVFLNAHANGTTTPPSLLSLLAGKNPITHGRFTRELAPYPAVENIFQILRDSGYSTAAVTSNSDAAIVALGLPEVLTIPEVFAFRFLALSWLRDFGVYPTRLGGRLYEELAVLLPFIGFPRRTSSYGRVDDTLDSAWNLLGRLPQPFFLFIHIHEPHDPYSLPDNFKTIQIPVGELRRANVSRLEFYSHYPNVFQPVVNAYKSQYEASVHRVDAKVGAFIDNLRERPWFGNSLIIFTADHGESFERGYFNHGEELYENSTWIPLIIRFPHQVNGERIAGLTQTIDIAPTILRAVNIELPAWMEGQALARNRPSDRRATFATNYRHPNGATSYPLPTKLAVWWKSYKMIVPCAQEATELTELYDLDNDPSEEINLTDQYTDVISEMKQRLRFVLAKQRREPKLVCPNA